MIGAIARWGREAFRVVEAWGTHHIIFNPRRLRDVRQILERTWARRDKLVHA